MKSFSHNIGILTWDYIPPKGGLGRTMRQLSELLKDMGHSVSVLSPSGGDCTVAPLTKKIGLHPLFSLCTFLCLPMWIRQSNCTVLLVPCGPGGVWVLRKPKQCTIIAIVHHTSWQQSALVPGQFWKRIFVPLEQRTLRLAGRVLCYGEDTRRVLHTHYHVHADIIPHPVDVPSQVSSAKKEAGSCLCIARLEKRKGVDVLLQAWETVTQVLPDAQLTIVGNGHLEKKTDRSILGQNTVRRIPFLPRAELLSRIAQAEILVCPSYFEGFGLTIAEAMALGTAVVASDADGISSLLSQGRTGVIVQPGNSDALAGALVSLLQDNERRKKLALLAQKEFSRTFSTQAVKRALQEVLESLY